MERGTVTLSIMGLASNCPASISPSFLTFLYVVPNYEKHNQLVRAAIQGAVIECI